MQSNEFCAYRTTLFQANESKITVKSIVLVFGTTY